MEEAQAAVLARYRVDQGAGGYYAKMMDKDESLPEERICGIS